MPSPTDRSGLEGGLVGAFTDGSLPWCVPTILYGVLRTRYLMSRSSSRLQTTALSPTRVS